MRIRAVLLGPLPPRQSGGPLSRARIASGLARAGHEICAVAPITTDSIKEGDWFAARHPELRLIRYWVPGFEFDLWKPLDRLEREQIHRIMGDLAGGFRPNILIAGTERYGPLARELADELALPWNLWLRGSPTAEIVSGLANEEEAAPYVDLFRSADLVISVARYMQVGLEERYGITGVRHIPNAVDLDLFRPRATSMTLRTELGISSDCAAILLPGTLIPRKRPMDVLRAAELVFQDNPAVVFLLAGVGPLRDELLRFCRERGMEHRIRFLGYCPYEQMPDLYNSTDLVVMTSEAEGMSRACIEALACGRPLLASDIPAARELIEDGTNGFLFELGNHRELARRILDLLADDARRLGIGPRARASVMNRNLEATCQAYAQEIQGLLRRTGRTP